MKADLRKSGIEIIGEVPWGTHFCQFYQSKEDLIEILVPYFKQGLENNEFCMWVTSEPLGAEDAKKALKEKVKNLDEYIKKGQIEILDYSQWYTKTGRFDADKVLEGWVKKEEQAIERGFDGLRLTGNTFWLEKESWESFTNYEAIVNSVIGKHRMLAVCSYSLDKCQASEIVDVVSNHQFAIIKKESKWVSLESSERKQAEGALQKSVQLLEDTGEMAKVGGWELDLSTKAVSWTEEVGRIHGVEPGYKPKLEEALSFYPPESRPDVEAAVKKAAETGEPYDLESLFIPSGSKDKIWVRSLGRAVYSGGKIVKLAGTFQNIDKYKKAEEALRASEIKHRTLLENLPQKIFLKDENLVYISCNENYARDLKIRPEEIAGKTDYDFYPKELAEKYRADDKRIMDSGKTEEIEEKYIQDQEERFVYTSKTPIKDAQRNVVGILGIFWDITERKRIEEALRESQKKYMDLFENANDSIYTMDLTGKLVSFNHTATEMLGYSEEEFSRLNMKDCLTPESYASAVQSIQKAVTEKLDLKELQPWEFKMIKKDGTIIDTEVRTRLIWKEGQILGIHGIARNFTERKKAEEELRVAYKKLEQAQQELIQTSKMAAMGQLAAGISHELNQPLTGIKGFAQAVLMDLEKESPLRNDLNKIVGQVDRMNTIIKNVRFFARKSDFNIVELDINQVILDSFMLLNQQLKVHNIRVIQGLGSDIPKMQGDPNQLQQAFLNIISNARDAILSLNRPEGGEVRIQTSLSQDRNHVEVIFQDTGCGIPEKNLPHMFSPFFTTKSPDKGMGLGLSITYRIIENHQGKIDFKTKAGEGTTFRIVLPLKEKIKQS